MNISEFSPRGAALMGYGVMLTKMYDPNDRPPGDSKTTRAERDAAIDKEIRGKMADMLAMLPNKFTTAQAMEANSKLSVPIRPTTLYNSLLRYHDLLAPKKGANSRWSYTKTAATKNKREAL